MVDSGKNIMEDWMLFNYLSGKATEDEAGKVEDWIAKDPLNKDHFDQLRDIWKYSDSVADLERVDLKGDWNAIRGRIGFERDQSRTRRLNPLNPNVYPFLKIAALIVLILGPAILLERKFRLITPPGIKWVSVASASLKRELKLPDGSNVTLNANSEISYPETFDRKKREIRLKGEAWFDVAESGIRPFFIYLGNDLVVKVLGTSFSIRSEERTGKVSVMVVSGKVSFYSRGKPGESILLEEGEQGMHDESGFSKSNIGNENFLSWKTGRLIFRDTPLREVASDLSDYSGMAIQVRGDELKNEILTSSYEGQDLGEILEEISQILNIDYSILNDTVIFHPAAE